MANLNVATIGVEVLSDLISDPAHMAKFEQFRADEIVGAEFIRPVSRLRGQHDMFPLAVTLPQDRANRPARRAPDAPTPKGDSRLDVLPYQCLESAFAHSLSFEGKSMAEFWAEVQDMLRNLAGMQVKLEVEQQLMDIFRGLGTAADFTAVTAVDIAAAGSKWNNYVGATHDPIRDIMALQRTTGATKIFLGSDVSLALLRSPMLTGSDAGSGVEYLNYAQLAQALNGIGFAEVMFGHLATNARPIEQAPLLKYAHDGVVAMWSPGTIRKFEFEAFQYDSYVDKDRRKEYYRALETSCFRVPEATSVGIFTNVLA